MEDFNYVLQNKEQERVCFGSCVPRETLPMRCVGGTKFESQYIGEIIPRIAPGLYDFGVAFNNLKRKVYSTRGVGGAIYTAPRFKYTFETTPFLEYDLPVYPQRPRCNKYPFNSSSRRFSSYSNNIPGVGAYEINASGKRKLPMKHRFGGTRILDTGGDVQCTPLNLDKCLKCGKIPIGDYWHLKRKSFLCRNCRVEEGVKPTLFDAVTIKKFRRMRDCSYMHDHQGTTASIKLIDKFECRNLAEKEAYFNLYFAERNGHYVDVDPLPTAPWPIQRSEYSKKHRIRSIPACKEIRYKKSLL